MDEIDFAAAVRTLHGDGMHPLRLAWRRSAQADRRTPTIRHRQARWGALALLGAAVSVSAVLLAGASRVRADDGAVPERIDRATLAFRERHFAQAYAEFARRADAGDESAALSALVMARHGPTLFNSAWSATPGQLRRWTALAMSDLRSHASQISGDDRRE